jgi:RHS repeat-associated protein
MSALSGRRPTGDGGPQGPRPAAGAEGSDKTSFFAKAPTLELPKGGGAIRGIGEKFTSNPVTGTGAMSVPIFASPGRGGFGPQLSLAYDSGAGNGPFGLGWSLSLPAITRKTDKGLPRYRGAEDDDVFLLSGAEDLVPELEPTGLPPLRWQRRTLTHDLYGRLYRVDLFRPRVEGLFARIERWTNVGLPAGGSADPNDVFWRTMSRDNVSTWYGRTAESRIQDPAEPARIYAWQPCEMHDDKGNVIVYEYVAENSQGVDLDSTHERNRSDVTRSAQRYLKRVRYGNTTPYFPTLAAPTPAPLPAAWLFELVFDYGEHATAAPLPQDAGEWPARSDPFSTHRPGFELRTYRLCRRALMFHHFPADPGEPDRTDVGPDYLVRSTRFDYLEPARGDGDIDDPATPSYTVLAAVQQFGHRRRADGTLVSRETPPLTFSYRPPVIDGMLKSIAAEQLDNLPVGTQGPGYQWIDLDGEGLPGVLSEQNGAWHYKPNLGDGSFGPSTIVREQPAVAVHAPGSALLQDIDGDGQLELVSLRDEPAGFHEHDSQGRWQKFLPFASLPNLDWSDPHLRFLDLSGEGHADALLTEDEAFTWYPSLAREGYAAGERVRWAADEEQGPRLVFAEATQTIFLADMCGDGLTDLVRIRNGEVCYWPNFGHGRFGSKVSLDNAPRFDHGEQFDPRRLRLADVDGSGPIDLIYLGRDGAHIYFNRSGNRLSSARTVDLPVATENLAAVQVADLLGAGTACLVWNSHLPADAASPVRYIDLMAEGKPHLLIGVDNNLGGSTQIDYTPSTRFYIQDKLAGTPWITRLPFPVHCVSRVTVRDKWRGTAFSSSYSYHHGYFDGVEREFRGFGRVEQIDSEDYARFAQDNAGSPWITEDWRLFQPPVKTITWFHTGVADDRERVLAQFADEYFPARYAPSGDFRERALPEPVIDAQSDPVLPAVLSDAEWCEAMRACKGMVLRQETYELDPHALAATPPRQLPTRLFGAATHNCRIRCLQPRGPNRHAVFHVTESEVLSYQYELPLSAEGALVGPDPRVSHQINLRVDELGNVQQAVAIGYPRWGRFDVASLVDSALDDTALDPRTLRAIRDMQAELHVAYVETRHTEDVELRVGGDDTPMLHRRLRLPCEVRTFELAGIEPSPGQYLTIDDFARLGLSDHYPPLRREGEPGHVERLPYHRLPQRRTRPQRREVEVVCSLYFDDNDGIDPPVDALPLGRHGPRGLKYEDYKLALTEELLAAVLHIENPPGHAPPQLLDWALNDGGPTARAVLDNSARSGYVRGAALASHFGVPADGMAGQYWLRSGIAGFAADARNHFFLPERYVDPFGATTTLAYDAHDLFVESSTDELGNRSAITRFDCRALTPLEFEDVNGNRTEACIDTLGHVIALAVKGKPRGSQWEGDDLSGFEAPERVDPAPVDVRSFCTATTADEATARRWLRRAGTRFVYHFGETVDAEGRTAWATRPATACAIVRERYAGTAEVDTSPLQLMLECSDGAGAVLMKKQQAEPEVDGGPLRWIVNGLTVLNNKGKPVRQYEPFFSADFGCQMPEEHGVTPLLYYDAAGRLVRTEMPDGTLSRVEFSPWHQLSFDASDTVLDSPWYTQWPPADTGRSPLDPAGRLPLVAGRMTVPAEDRARWLAARHAGTPALTLFDSLGREVIAIAHNRVEDEGGRHLFDRRHWRDEFYVTLTKFDAEGKPLWIRDARGNLVMQYITPTKPARLADTPPNPDNPIHGTLEYLPAESAPCYDIAGNLLFQHSMDAGDRWMLADAAGQAFIAWDINDRLDDAGELHPEPRLFHTEYDRLHRPLHLWLRLGMAPRAAGVERFEYRDAGDSGADEARAHNLIGQAVIHDDPAGRTELFQRSFTGQVEGERRRLARHTAERVVDWQAEDNAAREERLETESFTRLTAHDALGRMCKLANWHRGRERVAVYEPHYNARGLLDSEVLTIGATLATDGQASGGRTWQPVYGIRYNARGQRTRLCQAAGREGTETLYDHDERTFRLRQLRTTRPITDQPFPGYHSGLSNDRVVQQLNYTYDAAGNVAEIHDEAWEPVFFRNQEVEARNLYAYDALHRLIEATGRERASMSGLPDPLAEAIGVESFAVTNPGALRNYRQHYHYDAVGNFERMAHVADDGSWTRHYVSALDSNRLASTSTGTDRSDEVLYAYDTHASMLNLANVPPATRIRWDWRDMIETLDLVGGGRVWYAYDIGKQRTRKRIERDRGQIEERLYLGGLEVYREWTSSSATLPSKEIETHHLLIGDQRVLIVDDVLPPGDPRLGTGSLLRYQYGNHVGSVAFELDEEAKIIGCEEFHPYGTTAYHLVDRDVRSTAKRYRYTGMERDEDCGLNCHSARYFVPWLGRWCSADPLSIVDGGNLFQYATGNPVNRRDASGMQAREVDFDLWLVNQIDSLGWDDAAAGFGDTLTFGWTRGVRLSGGTDSTTDASSTSYSVGRAGAVGLQAAAVMTAAPAIVATARAAVVYAQAAPLAAAVVGGEFGLGLIDPHPPGASPLDLPGGIDDAGRALRAVIVAERRAASAAVRSSARTGRGSRSSVSAGTGRVGGDGGSGGRAGGGGGDAASVDVTVAEAAARGSVQDDLAATLEASPGERVFYAGTSAEDTVAARRSGHEITFDTKTSDDFVAVVLEDLGREEPGAHFYLGSGTHGVETGDWAAFDPSLAEHGFYLEDLGTTAPGQLPGLGARAVFDVATPAGATALRAAEQTAAASPPGSMFTMRAWCFSTASHP